MVLQLMGIHVAGHKTVNKSTIFTNVNLKWQIYYVTNLTPEMYNRFRTCRNSRNPGTPANPEIPEPAIHFMHSPDGEALRVRP